MAVRASGRGARRHVPAPSRTARRTARSSPQGDRPRSRRVTRSRGPVAAPTNACSSRPPSWFGLPRPATACSSPSTTFTTPTTRASTRCTTSRVRRTASRCASCGAPRPRPDGRHARRNSSEPHRASRRGRARARRARQRRHRHAGASPRRRAVGREIEQIAALGRGIPFAVNELALTRGRRARMGADARREHDRWHRPGNP